MPIMRFSPVVFVSRKVSVMIFTVWRRHQDFDVLADHFVSAVSKHTFGRGAKRLYYPLVIDHNHGFRNRVEDRLEMRFARARGRSAHGLFASRLVKIATTESRPYADQRERQRANCVT